MVKLEKVLILTFTKSMKAKALETKNIHKINTEVRLKRHTDFLDNALFTKKRGKTWGVG